MPRVVQKSKDKPKDNCRGSLRDIQLLVNSNTDKLNKKIHDSFHKLDGEEIEWLSPLTEDNYAEYSGADFIDAVIRSTKTRQLIQLDKFWPKRGPQWDALAVTNHGDIILVEAKANLPELVSRPSRASSTSKDRIMKSLECTKRSLDPNNEVDWSATYFQYANRIAHLWFLHERKKDHPEIGDAYLLNIYFLNDPTVKKSPKIESEWVSQINIAKAFLGLTDDALTPIAAYMADVFIDCNDLTGC